jgi:hypothetical protein
MSPAYVAVSLAYAATTYGEMALYSNATVLVAHRRFEWTLVPPNNSLVT